MACTLRRQVCIFVEKGRRLKQQVQNRVGESYRGLSSAASGGRREEGGGDGEARFAGMRELRSSNELLSANCTRLLQERLAADGYLLFRELLDREAVLALRRRIREALHDLNWINSQQDSEGDLKVQAAPKETMKLDAHEWPIFDRVQKLEEFHALPHSAALIAALEKIFGESVLMHPRHICRVHFPAQEANRTLPHQDYPYVQGDVGVFVCVYTHVCMSSDSRLHARLHARTGALARTDTHTCIHLFIIPPTPCFTCSFMHTHVLITHRHTHTHHTTFTTLSAGSDRFLTNWCPLGDVPAKMGPLAILVGSHKFGERRLMEVILCTQNPCTQHSLAYSDLCRRLLTYADAC